jgi:hypothetical protein
MVCVSRANIHVVATVVSETNLLLIKRESEPACIFSPRNGGPATGANRTTLSCLLLFLAAGYRRGGRPLASLALPPPAPSFPRLAAAGPQLPSRAPATGSLAQPPPEFCSPSPAPLIRRAPLPPAPSRGPAPHSLARPCDRIPRVAADPSFARAPPPPGSLARPPAASRRTGPPPRLQG